MLIANDRLEDLELGYNNLYAVDGRYCCFNVICCEIHLYILECMIPFLKGLKKNTQLLRLGLSWNGLTSPPQFGENLSKALAAHLTLQYIDLENNR